MWTSFRIKASLIFQRLFWSSGVFTIYSGFFSFEAEVGKRRRHRVGLQAHLSVDAGVFQVPRCGGRAIWRRRTAGGIPWSGVDELRPAELSQAQTIGSPRCHQVTELPPIQARIIPRSKWLSLSLVRSGSGPWLLALARSAVGHKSKRAIALPNR